LLNHLYTVAFKMMLEEQIRETKVINIEWRISRRGIYVPVAIYNSVYIDGTRLHRASAFNANHIKKWSMGNGTNIKIIRSGDVIPFIKDENVIVDNTITPIYPFNKYNWKWNNINIVLEDIDNNPIVQIKRIFILF
jgi:NAD-dependent DNA ligase